MQPTRLLALLAWLALSRVLERLFVKTALLANSRLLACKPVLCVKLAHGVLSVQHHALTVHLAAIHNKLVPLLLQHV